MVEGEVMGSRPTRCNKKKKVSVKVYCCHADDWWLMALKILLIVWLHMLYRWVTFFLILQSNVKTKEAIFIPNEIIDFTRDRGRERVVRHCEGEIKDHHHVRPSPTFNPTSCHQYVLPKPLLIQVSLNNKNWYQIWFRFFFWVDFY